MKIRRIKSLTLKTVLAVLALSYGLIVALSFHSFVERDLARMAVEEKSGKKSKGLIGEYFDNYSSGNKYTKTSSTDGMSDEEKARKTGDYSYLYERPWTGGTAEEEHQKVLEVRKRLNYWTPGFGPPPPEVAEAEQREARAHNEELYKENAEYYRLHPDLDPHKNFK